MTVLTRSLTLSAVVALLASCSSPSDPPPEPEDTGAVDSGTLDGGIPVDTGGTSTGTETDTSGDVDDSRAAFGEPCDIDDDCQGRVCLRIAAGLEEGFCSGFCFESSDCPSEEETWDCVFLRNSGADAAFLCVPEDLCIDNDDDNYGLGPGCLGSDCDDEMASVNPAADELCDGFDNDCDSNIDDNPVDTNVDCNTGYEGICAAGRTICDGGVLSCNSEIRPSTEICDSLDNDCDGTVDLGPEGEPLTTACYGGPAGTEGIGQCIAGARLCTDGVTGECIGQVLPFPELCDGIDNDCDTVIDEDNPESGRVCDTGALGACASGITSCEGGALSCVPNTASSDEVCDGVDNDCDGQADEDEDGEALAVGCYEGPDGTEDVGICVGGTRTCGDGEFGICEGDVIPGIELCDGLDNDCDGETDEGDPAGGFNCDTGLLGVCAQGQTTCGDGGTTCEQLFEPTDEVCDGFDNDCDGLVDEGLDDEALSEACYGGPAGTEGVGICVAGTRTCLLGEWQTCQAQVIPALTELCDNLDNDCDGTTDEDAAGTGVACATGLSGVCATGTTTCAAGAAECTATVTPGTHAEVCDNVDNDCDGTTDEGYDLGEICVVGRGVCQAAGVVVCGDDGLSTTCSAEAGSPELEVCDGLDNDCNGMTDEGFTYSSDPENPGASYPLGSACAVGQGVCRRGGVVTCGGVGNAICDAAVIPGSAEVCNYLDDDCDGEVDEAFVNGAGLYDDDANCGACGIDCLAIYDFASSYGYCDTSSGAARCELGCDAGAFDLNGIPDDGCEFVLDTGAIYVSAEDPSASDDGACGYGPVGTGTGYHPCESISYGLMRAGTSGRSRVVVADGLYQEDVTLRNGVSLYGGYRADTWERHLSNTLTTIRGTSGTGHRVTVNASSITLSTTVEGFIIEGANASTASSNSYGIRSVNSTAALQIRNNWIYAGDGAAGVPGAHGSEGVAGSAGTAGLIAMDTTSYICTESRSGGSGGANTCSGVSTSGGAGGGNRCVWTASGVDGSALPGLAGANNILTYGEGGASGIDGYYDSDGCGLCHLQGEMSGINGAAGRTGSWGTGGSGHPTTRGNVSGLHWVGYAGSGGVNGGHGGGGGGGGAGGGGDSLISDCTDDFGGTGGGGGAGGCGGTAGGGGSAGGGSFGIFLSAGASAPVISGNTIVQGNGGNGGNGGRGGSGGTGGAGAAGGREGTSTYFCSGTAGTGGNGGNAGHGGGGGGGNGGVSVGILSFATDPAEAGYAAANSFPASGAAGNGGAGGTSSGNPGSDGHTGDATNVLVW